MKSMNNRLSYLFTLIVLGALLIGLLYCTSSNRKIVIEEFNSVDRPARIHPDYINTVIPPNIAPLNFLIREKGTRYFVKIYSEQGKGIDIYSRRPCIEIPIIMNQSCYTTVRLVVVASIVTASSITGRIIC